MPKGTTDAAPQSPESAVPITPRVAQAPRDEAQDARRAPGLERPEETGALTPGREQPRSGDRGGRRSIASAAREYLERHRLDGPRGLASGTGQQMGPLFFDPEGADFTAWINHFKNEVYRNWMIPQAAVLGVQGAVDIAFVVARDGTLRALTVERSSGTISLDRSARNALLASRLRALPPDYGPDEVTMQVRFIYG